jgi:hypothetical protein
LCGGKIQAEHVYRFYAEGKDTLEERAHLDCDEEMVTHCDDIRNYSCDACYGRGECARNSLQQSLQECICGRTPDIHYIHGYLLSDRLYIAVGCDECKLSIYAHHLKEAEMRWNEAVTEKQKESKGKKT